MQRQRLERRSRGHRLLPDPQGPLPVDPGDLPPARPNARVWLSWGGWQARWDDRATGAGRSLFRHFADVLAASDFQSFQAMAIDSNTGDIRAMVQTLGAYGPVMLAHYKPDNGSGAVFEADVRTIFTDRYLAEVTRHGLFAMSFMDGTNLAASSELHGFVRAAVRRYARP